MPETLVDGLAHLLLLAGALFMFIAAVGLLRMPDLMTRMHATTKASVLGAALMLSGVALHFGSGTLAAKMLAVIVFITLTSPVAAHIIGRAGYASGIRLWPGTVKDALAEPSAPSGPGAETQPPPG
jgi:multicomponent Na+:H+ antiporter subunit G